MEENLGVGEWWCAGGGEGRQPGTQLARQIGSQIYKWRKQTYIHTETNNKTNIHTYIH